VSTLETEIGTLTLRNPVICGSGEHVMTEAGIDAALRTGAAGVVAKSLNESVSAAEQLDIADYVLVGSDQRLREWGAEEARGASLLCRSGLQQIGREQWIETIARADRKARRSDQFVAASLVYGELEGALDIARAAGQAGIRIFELNMGSPLSYEAAKGSITSVTEAEDVQRTVALVREAFGGIVWAKLTGLSNNLPELAEAARAGGAESVGLAGRLMGFLPDLDSHAPVLNTSAGYGGPWALPIACRWVALARRRLGPDYSLIGTNGARGGLDVARFVLSGASGVELTSLVMQEGFGALEACVEDLRNYVDGKATSIKALVGVAADRMQTYAERSSHSRTPGHWKNFVPAQTLSECAVEEDLDKSASTGGRA